jgi:hypothetical protein
MFNSTSPPGTHPSTAARTLDRSVGTQGHDVAGVLDALKIEQADVVTSLR